MKSLRHGIGPSGAQGGEQRQQMLFAGVRPDALGAVLAVVQQAVQIALRQVFGQPIGKHLHIGRCAVALHAGQAQIAQVVGHVARAHDPNILRRQTGQRLTDAVGVGRAGVALHRQGNHRHIGIGKHLAQGNPGAMVQATLCIGLHLKAMGLQGGDHFARRLRAAGGRVVDVVQRTREAIKVVNGLKLRGQAHGGQGRFPMWADHHNRAWRRQLLRHLAHGRTCGARVQGERGGAMRHKQDIAQGGGGGQ